LLHLTDTAFLGPHFKSTLYFFIELKESSGMKEYFINFIDFVVVKLYSNATTKNPKADKKSLFLRDWFFFSSFCYKFCTRFLKIQYLFYSLAHQHPCEFELKQWKCAFFLLMARVFVQSFWDVLFNIVHRVAYLLSRLFFCWLSMGFCKYLWKLLILYDTILGTNLLGQLSK
jgi:hypothetical protein